MESKKPRVLDFLRLIIAILTFVGALIVAIYMVLAICWLFSSDNEDGFSGLIFIGLIPLIIGALVYAIIGFKWIKKYNKTKNIPLIQRSVGLGECIIKMVISVLFLTYLAIPFVLYWALDLIEVLMRKNLAEKMLKSEPKSEFRTNETHPIEGANRCKYCGKEVDYRYARFCEHCGAEIEYRK